MSYLLDVSVLLAWLWSDHEYHERVARWQKNQSVAVCPITELGFLRISSQPVFGATVTEAREMLSVWRKKALPKDVACDLLTLHSDPPSVGSNTTDYYLASLAAKNGMKWATLDENCRHRATFVLPA